MLRSTSCLAVLTIAGVVFSAAIAQAQNALFADHDGRLTRVLKMDRGVPLVADASGALVRASKRRLLLHADPEYLPRFVFVHDISAIAMQHSSLHSEFEYSATLVSPWDLKNVFIVLDVTMIDGAHTYALWEIGDLVSYRPQPFKLSVTSDAETINAGRYFTHVFSDGQEVFNTTQGWDYIDGCIDQMVAKRTIGLTNASARPYFGPPPEIPPALRTRKGHVVIHCKVDARGRVIVPEVKSADDAELGQACVAALRLWRFFPKFVRGEPIASNVSIPFDFPP